MIADPDLEPTEHVRLAAGSPLLNQQTTAGATLANRAAIPRRRFVWPRLHTHIHWVWASIFTFVVGYALYCIGLAFIGTWVFSLPVLGLLAATLLFLYYLLRGYGEYLPLLGRSWVEVSAKGVRFRLFYGRKPVATFRGFRLPGLYWPARARIAWQDIARAALYQTSYLIEGRTQIWYWVKLWRRDASSYVLLITTNQPDAAALMQVLVESSHLQRWLSFDEQGAQLDNPSLGPADPDTLALWQADAKRMTLRGYKTVINGDLWCRPLNSSFALGRWFSRRTIRKLIALALLIATLYNYDLMLSYLLWTPPAPSVDSHLWIGPYADAANSNAVSQTFIPPLHEAWSAPVHYSNGYYSGTIYQAGVSIAAGKVAVFSNSDVAIYEARTGRQIAQYPLPNIADCDTNFGTISPDGRFLYYLAYHPSGARACYDSTVDIAAIEIATGQLIWRQIIGQEHQFAIAANGLIVAAGSGSSLLAINATDGKLVWENQIFTDTRSLGLSIAGDTVYVLHGTDPAQLSALELTTGKTRWQVNSNFDTYSYARQPLADEHHAYVIQTNSTVSVYDHDTGKLTVVSSDNELGCYISSLALQENRLYTFGCGYANPYRQSTIFVMEGTRITYLVNSPKQLISFVLGRDVIFASDNQGITGIPFIQSHHLVLYDRHSGEQIWRSPGYPFPNSKIVIGEGMLLFVADNQLHALTGARQ